MYYIEENQVLRGRSLITTIFSRKKKSKTEENMYLVILQVYVL